MAAAGYDDLGSNDGFVFRALAAGPMSVSALAVRLDITKQGAAQIVDDMERRGYVRRRPDPADGRARLVELSSRGTSALSTARAFHRRFERGLGRRHGAAGVLQLRELLTDMAGGEAQTLDPRLRAGSL